MKLYAHPEVYATLLAPEPDLFQEVLRWLDLYMDGPRESVMDPCCGPATWLLPFSVYGHRVAGNDLSAVMIEESRRRLGEGAELIQGDMRALEFTGGPFDVAVNMSASVGHLPDLEAVTAHLRSVHGQLRPGGLYFMGLCVFDGDRVDEEVLELFESPPTLIPSGGMAAVRYESVRRDPATCRETIRLTLLTSSVAACPPRLDDEYELQTFRYPELLQLLEDLGGFDLMAVHAMEEEGYPDRGLHPNCGDVTLVLRRRS